MTKVVRSLIGITGGNYNTISEWMSDTAGDLVSLDVRHIGIVYNSGLYDSKISTIAITGNSNTDETRYRQLMAGERYNHVSQTGILFKTTGPVVTGGENYFRFGPGFGISGSRYSGSIIDLTGQGVVLDSLFVLGLSGTETGIYLHNTNNVGAIVNTCVLGSGFNVGIKSEDNVLLYNNTIYENTTNAAVGVQSGNAVNVIAIAYIGMTGCLIEYSLSKDNSATGMGSLTGKSAVDQFYNHYSGSEDLHVKSSLYSDSYSAGKNLSLDIEDIDYPMTSFEKSVRKLAFTDYEDRERTTWDIGAFEFSGRLKVTPNITNDNFSWYKSEWNSSDPTGFVGGNASNNILYSGPIDLFPELTGTSATTGFSRFRKVFVKSTSADILYNPRAYIENPEYYGQVFIAPEITSGDFMTGDTDYPPGYSSSDFIEPFSYSGGIQFSNVEGTGQAGIWIKITLTGAISDPQVGFGLVFEGTKE